MNYKKLIVLIVSIFMVFLIPIIFYMFTFNSIAFDENFYKKEFAKYNVYAILNEYDVEQINENVLKYLQNENNKLESNNFFNQREVSHFRDVKVLIQKSQTVYRLSLFLFLLFFTVLIILFRYDPKKIIEKFLIVLFFGSSLAVIYALFFFFLVYFNFNFTFDLFHKTLFPLGTFSFNPDFEKIVVLYPENLFLDALIRILVKTVLSSVIIIIVSIIALFYFFNGIISEILSVVSRRWKKIIETFKYYF